MLALTPDGRSGVCTSRTYTTQIRYRLVNTAEQNDKDEWPLGKDTRPSSSVAMSVVVQMTLPCASYVATASGLPRQRER